jgi:hypothetical protein
VVWSGKHLGLNFDIAPERGCHRSVISVENKVRIVSIDNDWRRRCFHSCIFETPSGVTNRSLGQDMKIVSPEF